MLISGSLSRNRSIFSLDVYALNASTGAQLAEQYTITGDVPQISVVDGVLYAGTDSSASAIDPVHHRQIWQKGAVDLGFTAHTGFGGFSVSQGSVYVTLESGHLSYCLSLNASNGQTQW